MVSGKTKIVHVGQFPHVVTGRGDTAFDSTLSRLRYSNIMVIYTCFLFLKLAKRRQ